MTTMNNVDTCANLTQEAKDRAAASYITDRDELIKSTKFKPPGLLPDIKMPGLKYDTGKLRWDLLPLKLIRKIVDVLTFGSIKYEDNSWQGLADAENRYYAAMMRHLDAWRSGELIDPESGRTHLAHAACNIIFLLWFEDKAYDK